MNFAPEHNLAAKRVFAQHSVFLDWSAKNCDFSKLARGA